jgi:hypothetical protein
VLGLDLGADPLPRSKRVAPSHPRAARPGTFDGSSPPLDDWTYRSRHPHLVKCLPPSAGQWLAQRVHARNLLSCLPPSVPPGTKIWTRVSCDTLPGVRRDLLLDRSARRACPVQDSAKVREGSHSQKKGVKPKPPLTPGFWEVRNNTRRGPTVEWYPRGEGWADTLSLSRRTAPRAYTHLCFS